MLGTCLVAAACAPQRSAPAPALPICDGYTAESEPLNPRLATLEGETSAGNSASTEGAIDRPRLQNRREVADALRRHYPADLRRAGIGGTVVLDVLVSPDGAPRTASVARSSGRTTLDQAALEVVRVARYSPGVVTLPDSEQRCRMPVWISFPLAFTLAD